MLLSFEAITDRCFLVNQETTNDALCYNSRFLTDLSQVAVLLESYTVKVV